MDDNKPRCHDVHQIMENVGVRHPIYSCTDGSAKEQYAGDVPQATCDLRHHLAGRQILHQQDEGHDGEDIVVRGERCEPVDSKISYPHGENREVDGKHPEHEEEDRMRVVIVIGASGRRDVVDPQSASDCK